MVGRKKGTPKTGGRTAGTPNKTTAAIKEWIVSLIDANKEQIENDLTTLEPKERLQIFLKLMDYVVPKAQIVPEGEEKQNDMMLLIQQSVNQLNQITDEAELERFKIRKLK